MNKIIFPLTSRSESGCFGLKPSGKINLQILNKRQHFGVVY